MSYKKKHGEPNKYERRFVGFVELQNIRTYTRTNAFVSRDAFHKTPLYVLKTIILDYST